MASGPLPGEVWVQVSDGRYQASWGASKINGAGKGWPFIVTSLTHERVNYTTASREGQVSSWVQTDEAWEWHSHFQRLWPTVPTWDELRAAGAVSDG